MTAHDHQVYVEGCFRCDLSREETKQPSITCPKCGMTSYNQNDIAEGYCGNCHEFTSPPYPQR